MNLQSLRRSLTSTVFLFFSFLQGNGQTDSVVKYFRYQQEVNTSDKALTRAVYYYKDGLWWMESRYVSSGLLAMKGSFKEGPEKTPHGQFESYFESGKIERREVYENGKSSGLYITWFENGHVSDSLFYRDDRLYNKSRSWNRNGDLVSIYDLDENGNGSSKLYWGQDSLFGEGNYASGKKTGLWSYYTKEGKKKWEMKYQDGKRVSEKCLDESNTANESCIFEKEAEFKGGDNKWSAYLSEAISEENYPSKKLSRSKRTDLFGKVMAQFVVDKDGNVIDVRIIQSLNEVADAIVIRVLQNSPKWIPAVQYGRRVKAYRLQPVTFKESNF
jgi:antitoxin component YwqK of YwqJK toxin-antitoxin module